MTFIVGIAEGNIACRRMPRFLRDVPDSKERQRFCSSIQAEVYDQLVLHLDQSQGISISLQTTRSIIETILDLAELTNKVIFPEIYKL